MPPYRTKQTYVEMGRYKRDGSTMLIEQLLLPVGASPPDEGTVYERWLGGTVRWAITHGEALTRLGVA